MRALATLTLSLLVSAAALAAPGTAPQPPAQPPPSGSIKPSSASAASGPRQEAEQTYALAHEEVEKAKKDIVAGKAKNAQKKFKRALERSERAVALDSRYHEAWNLVGYCSRKLGDFPKAFAAYEKCLAIEPNYVPAREYLGEAYVDQGEPAKARAQLAVLDHLGATEEAGELRGLIEAYEKAHPEKVAAPAPSPAPADTSGTPVPADTTGSGR